MPHQPANQTKAGWYSVRCVFEYRVGIYEERITLWRAASFDEAIRKAEVEAVGYTEGLDLTYLGLAQAYRIRDEDDETGEAIRLTEGVEVFSLMRDSNLEPVDYLATFFATGTEHAGDL